MPKAFFQTLCALPWLLSGCLPSGDEEQPPGSLPPFAAIATESGLLTGESGEQILLQGIAQDSDGEIVAHEWRDSDGSVLSSSAELSWRFPDAQNAISMLYRARDNNGVWSAPAGVVLQTAGTSLRPHALRLNGGGLNDDGRVKIAIDAVGMDRGDGPAIDIGDTDFTIEFWLRGGANDNRKPERECGDGIAWIHGNIVLDRDRYGASRKYGISLLGGKPAFGVSRDGDFTLCAETNVLDREWHHLAFTRRLENGELSVFVDGRRVARTNGPRGDISYPDGAMPGDHCAGPCLASDPFLVIGAEKHDVGPEYPGFTGLIDELRFSRTVRYVEDFQPPSRDFQPDAATAALFHFNEGEGRVIADSSGQALWVNGILHIGGSPRGPRFVPIEDSDWAKER